MSGMVIDTSAIIAVLLSEPERRALVRVSRGAELVAPASVHWEIGNALSAALKWWRVAAPDAQRALTAYAAIPMRFIEVDLALSLELAAEHALYAYDAYLFTCALQQRAPLRTLDSALARAASRWRARPRVSALTSSRWTHEGIHVLRSAAAVGGAPRPCLSRWRCAHSSS